jgi:hypothetical protein
MKKSVNVIDITISKLDKAVKIHTKMQTNLEKEVVRFSKAAKVFQNIAEIGKAWGKLLSEKN